MSLFSTLYAMIAATIFIFLYIKTYSRYFFLRKYYFFGITLLILSIFIQFISTNINDLNIKYIGLLSFITYPISIFLISLSPNLKIKGLVFRISKSLSNMASDI